MELKVRFLRWSAGIPVAMLSKETAIKMGAHIHDRVSIKTHSNNSKEIFTIIDIVEGLVKNNEIVVSSEIKKIINLKVKQKVEVNIAQVPKSLEFIKKKLIKKTLTESEISEIIEDVVNNSLSEPEIALFISAMYNNGMNFKETFYLTKAILKGGERLSFKNKKVVDKHSIGGIAGNRTTPIVVSICAAAGLIVPKSSSRAITSPAGTSDVIECIANVEFSAKEVKKIIKKTNACLIWGGALEIAPADSKIINLERMLNIDPEAQLVASIMAKKLAMGAKYIIIDIPYGKTAKVNKEKAERLKRRFEELGRAFRKKVKVILMEAREPMGTGVGPVLELIDVISVLDPSKKGPVDLKKKSLILAGELLEMTKKAKKGEGVILARKILYSGKAFKKFKEIILAQGGSLSKMNKLKPAKFKKDIFSKRHGRINEIDNLKINSLARIAGCPADKLSGLQVPVSVGDIIKKGTKLMTIYSESRLKLKQAIKFYEDKKPIEID